MKKAIIYGKRAEKLADSINLNELRYKIYKDLSYAYELNKDYVKSLKYHKKFQMTKDSVFSQENAKKFGRMDAEREQLIKEREEEERLRSEAAAISRRDNLQYSIISILAIIVFIVIYYLSRKKISFGVIDTLTFLTFLLVYEFLLVFSDPWVDSLTGGVPLYKLATNFAIALIFVPIHKLEQKFKNKLNPENG